MLILPSANRVYAESAVGLTAAELEIFAGAVLGDGIADIAAEQIAGVPYVTFESAALDERSTRFPGQPVVDLRAVRARERRAAPAGAAAPARPLRRRPGHHPEVHRQDQRAVHQAAAQRHPDGLGVRRRDARPAVRRAGPAGRPRHHAAPGDDVRLRRVRRGPRPEGLRGVQHVHPALAQGEADQASGRERAGAAQPQGGRPAAADHAGRHQGGVPGLRHPADRHGQRGHDPDPGVLEVRLGRPRGRRRAVRRAARQPHRRRGPDPRPAGPAAGRGAGVGRRAAPRRRARPVLEHERGRPRRRRRRAGRRGPAGGGLATPTAASRTASTRRSAGTSSWPGSPSRRSGPAGARPSRSTRSSRRPDRARTAPSRRARCRAWRSPPCRTGTGRSR